MVALFRAASLLLQMKEVKDERPYQVSFIRGRGLSVFNEYFWVDKPGAAQGKLGR
jgi:hypothetical protein